MINIEIFLIGLAVISTLTGLVTEAVKKILNSKNKTYSSDILAGIVAAVLSVAIGVGYVILAGVGFTAQSIILIIVLTFASWLCSMVGYDKVLQVISQFKTIKKG